MPWRNARGCCRGTISSCCSRSISAGFLAAGQALGLATSTVSRRIDELEARLGATVVHRRATGVVLRESARPLVDLARTVGSRIDAALRGLDDDAVRVGGSVRVALGPGFVPLVAPTVARFRRLHPDVEIDLVSETRAVDLAAREADIAIRTSRSQGAAVVVRRVGELRYGLYGAAALLRERGRPRARQLSDYPVIGYAAPLHRLPALAWLREHGVKRFRVRANTTEAVLALALAAEGLAALPSAAARSHPELEHLRELGDLGGPAIHIAMHREARDRAAVAALADALAETLRAALAL